MKRSTGFSSGMYNSQYSSKKKAWKWTPAKIAAFTLFGAMMAALFYFESSSHKYSNGLAPNLDQSSSLSTPSEFDKEYQEFIKQGEKVVSQKTLDSLNAVQNANLSPIPEDDPEISVPSNNRSAQREASASPNPGSYNANRTPDNIENSLESVDFIPPSNNGGRQDISGTLQEANPNQYQPTVLDYDRNRNTQEDQVITEEFYIEETVTGRVAAISNGVPLQGVKIAVKGTTNIVETDANGQYSIVVPGDPAHRTIQYSYQSRYTERDVTPGTNVMNILF